MKDEKVETITTTIEDISKNPTIDNIMLRDHLIFQNMMNNVSLAVRDGRPIDFSIERMTMTKDKINVVGFKYVDKQTIMKEETSI